MHPKCFENEIIIIIIIIITYLTRVNPSSEAVINGCPGQLKNEQLKEIISITDQLSEKYKNYVQCRWIKTKNYITTKIKTPFEIKVTQKKFQTYWTSFNSFSNQEHANMSIGRFVWENLRIKE